MISFYDVSVWQKPETVANLARTNGDKILAVKASEGATLKDRNAVKHINATKDFIECYILYHFMRCDKNAGNIGIEVNNFISACEKIKTETGVGKFVLALDFERCDNIHKYSDYANKAHRDALMQAINLLQNRYGVAPYVYACESEYKGLLRHGVSIPWAWVARYGGTNPPARCGIWQYTNTGGKIDRNRYLGESVEQFKRKEVIV